VRFKGALFMSALAGSVGLIASPATGASAAASLPLGGFYQIVADSAHGHLFLSEGASQNGILVTTLSGAVVKTITGETGAEGMALSPDGGTLYVALSGADAVSAISTATLTETARYPLGTGNTPLSVAVQSGKVWVGYSPTPGQGAIGDIDLTVSSPAFAAQPTMGDWLYTPELAADPSGGGILVGALPGGSPAFAASYNVSGATPTVLAGPESLPLCENETDVAVAPGGSEFVLACGSPYDHLRYSTANLKQLGDYPSNSYPNAIAIAANGTVAAGAFDWYGPDVYIYHQDSTTALNIYEFGGPTWNLADRGLAWSADGTKLYAVVQNMNTNAYALRVLNDPQVTAATLTLGGTTSAVLGKSVTLTGKLALNVGKPPAGTKITITRTLAGSHSAKQFTVTLASNDTFKLTDRPDQLGTYTYAAHYSGDATRQPATTIRTVNILRFPVSLTLSANASTVDYKSSVTVTAHLGKTYTGRTVSIYAQPFGSKIKKLLKSGRVSSSGTLTVSYAPVYSTAFSAVFGGDARYAPRTVTRDVYVRAKVDESISGYFSTTYINGVLYRVYQHTAKQRLDVTVTPNKAGECVEAEGQIFAQGAWQPDLLTGCAYLSSSSTTFGYFNLSQVTGYQLRIRADYIRSGKDNKNLGNHSYWLYFEVVT